MKDLFSAPGDYIHFKSQVPLHRIPIGTKQWRYYDFGPKVVPPLVCLPGTAGTAEVYYKQIMALSMKGYRVISVDIPRVWNHHEWIQAFEKFLDAIDVHHIHLYGTALGGFLAQLFAQHRPRRVRSLILSNSFLDTRSFSASMPWAPIVSWTPSFLLKRYVLTGIPAGPHEPFIADSVDFVVSQVETLSKDDLASRLTLTVDPASIGSLLLSDSFITIMDTNDYCAIPQELKDQLSERYPGARKAYLKTGRDFPFLSRSDEVNLHLQLHLRRVGVEARPDLVRNIPKEGNDGGSPSKHNDKEEDPKDPPKDDNGSSENPSAENQPPPAPESSESHGLEDLPLNQAKSRQKDPKDKEEDSKDPPKDDNGNSENPSAESQPPPTPESSESHGLEDLPLNQAKIRQKDPKDKEEDPKDPPKDDNGISENPSAEGQPPPAPESSESHGLEDLPLNQAKIRQLGSKDYNTLSLQRFVKKQHIVPAYILILPFFAPEISVVHFLLLYMGSLYTVFNYLKFRQTV